MKCLKDRYNEVYADGKENFHTFPLQDIYEEVIRFIGDDLKGKYVVDLGCGDGEFVNNYLNKYVKRVLGVDFSKKAIEKANESCMMNTIFLEDDFEKKPCIKYLIEDVDIVTSIGVIEHLDNPEAIFQRAYELLKPGGILIVEHPHFMNIRGIIWKTLDIFTDAVMSKTDKHILTNNHVQSMASKYDFVNDGAHTFRNSQGNGPKLYEDFDRRLRLALASTPNYTEDKVDDFMEFLEEIIKYDITTPDVNSPNKYNGAEIIWKFIKK